jgi:transcriptional regulator with XRE-family HTH domain
MVSGAALVAALAVPRLVPNAVSVAVEFGYAGSGWAGPIVFHIWLRRQLRERRMSQRSLAARSGVNHSTISRLLRGDRTPNLETATKLASALRPLAEVDDLLRYFSAQEVASVFPTKRVEAALRGDGDLTDWDVRQLMDDYLRRRADRRRARHRRLIPRLDMRNPPEGRSGDSQIGKHETGTKRH